MAPAFFLLLALFGSTVGSITPARAAPPQLGVETGLPLPRYVSLKANKANVRVGPSRSHPVLWVYHRKGLPVEIIAEFEHWRRIRDSDGDIGWIFHSLLDGRRTALVKPANGNETLSLHIQPSSASPVLAAAEPDVVVDVVACQVSWCQVSAEGYTGWAPKADLWGIYSNENFN